MAGEIYEPVSVYNIPGFGEVTITKAEIENGNHIYGANIVLEGGSIMNRKIEYIGRTSESDMIDKVVSDGMAFFRGKESALIKNLGDVKTALEGLNNKSSWNIKLLNPEKNEE